ncbi:MAG: hypothetical protein K1X64_14570 [Myxococcaceae bacterium]|nr:hypothetical protein [Myxococcaceae bacterium]
MAIPPEPLRDLLPQAAWVVEGVVTEVLAVGSAIPPPSAAPGATSRGVKVASQTVKLKVTRLLRGPASSELTVTKPEAGYALKAGDQGPFLIDAQKNILGRYGPDSYALAEVEQAL